MEPQANSQFSPRLPFPNRLFRWLFALIWLVLFKVKVTGKENIPKGNCIIVANHLSWIDHVLLLTVIPAEPRPYLLGAAQSIASPFKAWLFNTFGGVVSVERGAKWVGKDALRAPIRVLESGATLGIFPEGEAGREEGQLLPFKRGVGHVVLRANYPILPIALSGVQDLYWRKEILVTIGAPFRVQVEGLDHHAAIDAAMSQVEGALRAVLPVYHEPVVAHKPLHFLSNIADRL